MVQLSDLVRVTRWQAAEPAFHFEAVAHVEAQHTDDWLVHRSGDERALAKFSRRVSLSTPTSGNGMVRPCSCPVRVKCDWRAFYPLSTLGNNTTFKVHYPPRSIIEIGSSRVFDAYASGLEVRKN